MITFQEEATTGNINVSESEYRDKENKSRSVEFTCSYNGDIALDTEAEYKDKEGNILIDGKIKKSKQTGKDPNTDDRLYEIEIFDNGYVLIDGNLNKIFRDQTPEQIIETIVTNRGLTFSNEIGTSIYAIGKKTYRDKQPIKAVNDLCDTLGASWTVRGTTFYLYKRQEKKEDFDINENTKWQLGTDGWVKDTDQQAKTIIIKGAEILQRTTENLSGTGTEFVLSRNPEDVEIEGLTQTTEHIDGDYEVDKQQKTITFENSQTDPVIKYSYYSQLRVQVGTNDPIKVLNKKYIENKTEARNLGRRYLEIYEDGIMNAEWETSDFFINVKNVRPGNKIQVINKINTEKNGEYLIKNIKRDYPEGITLEVGEAVTDLFDWQKETKDRIEQLEEKEQNQDYVSRDVFLKGKASINIQASLSYIFGVFDNGEVLFASDTALSSGGDMIYDDGSEPSEYPIAYDDNAIQVSSYIDYT